MSIAPSGSESSAGDRLLQEYLDALLPPGVEPAAARFWLVSAGGLQLALRATEAQPIADGEDYRFVGADPIEVVDLGRVVRGLAGSGEPGSRSAYLRVPAFPGRVLRVERVQGLIEVEDRAVRWRKSRQPRPWLSGMLDSPAAAVLSVHQLVLSQE